LAAARDAQTALSGPIRVRMGVHTGEPLVTDEGYVGIDVHRAARIAAVGHGGQVLVSQSTRDLVGPDGLRDLGEHRLKDLAAEERIYQLGDDAFPPLRSLNQTNLPLQPTPLIGRERELDEVLDLVRSHRVVTLTGAGGSGKTRLALQAAAELVEEFEDGVWFVPLAAVTDAALTEGTIASVLGAKNELELFLSDRRTLLVLDNLEQLLPDAAPVLGGIAAHVLATSRERLNVYGEQEYPVPTLPVRDAATLFTERARQLKPDFEADEQVIEIVRRLDGLPLAVELAAARVKVLTTEQIRQRLDDSLALLTSGARDVPERHRTLRATIAWSYELLSPEEQTLFERLAVFVGFDLDAAESICDATIDGLQSLVDKSLLRQTSEGRFFMLATIRDYALQRLAASAEFEDLRERHVAHYAALAERAGRKHHFEGVVAREFSRDEDNFRAALGAVIEEKRADDALRFCFSLRGFWQSKCRFEEARYWLAQALGLESANLRLRQQALLVAGWMALFANDNAAAEALFEAAADLARVIGDPRELAEALRALGGVVRDDRSAGIPFLEEALAISRRIGDREIEAGSLHLLGEVLRDIGEFDRGAALLESSAAISRELGRPGYASATTHSLGDLEFDRGDLDRAESHYRQSLRVAVDVGSDRQVATCIAGLAAIAARRGNTDRAARLWLAVEKFEVESRARLLEHERLRYSREIDQLVAASNGSCTLEEAVELALGNVD
jgi:predicted ATPase